MWGQPPSAVRRAKLDSRVRKKWGFCETVGCPIARALCEKWGSGIAFVLKAVGSDFTGQPRKPALRGVEGRRKNAVHGITGCGKTHDSYQAMPSGIA